MVKKRLVKGSKEAKSFMSKLRKKVGKTTNKKNTQKGNKTISFKTKSGKQVSFKTKK